MRFLIFCSLLAFIAFANAKDNADRSRRHLGYIMSKLFGYNLYEPFQAGPEIVQEKVVEVPTHDSNRDSTIALLESYLGTTTPDETLQSLRRMKSLLESGILSPPQPQNFYGYQEPFIPPQTNLQLQDNNKPNSIPSLEQHHTFVPPNTSIDLSNGAHIDPRAEQVIIHSPIEPVVVDVSKSQIKDRRDYFPSNRVYPPAIPYSIPANQYYHRHPNPYMPLYENDNIMVFRKTHKPYPQFRRNRVSPIFAMPFGLFAPMPLFPQVPSILVQKSVPFDASFNNYVAPHHDIKPTYGLPLHSNLENNVQPPALEQNFRKPGFYFDIVPEFINNDNHIPLNSNPGSYGVPESLPVDNTFSGYHYGPSSKPKENDVKNQKDNEISTGYVYVPPHLACANSLDSCKEGESSSGLKTSDKTVNISGKAQKNTDGYNDKSLDSPKPLTSASTSESSTEAPIRQSVDQSTTPEEEVKLMKMSDSNDDDDMTTIIIKDKPIDALKTDLSVTTDTPLTTTPESTTISIQIGQQPELNRGDIPGLIS